MIDPDDAESENSTCVLNGEMPESATGAGNDDPVTGFGVGFAEAGVDC